MLGIVFGAFVVLLFLGLPIAGSMIFATLLPSFTVANFPGNLNYILRATVSGLDQMSILAIPLFMLSGAIMAQGGISRKLFDIFAVFIGKFKAGMPCAVVVTCLFYGAISGSGPATVAAVGAMCIPVLTEMGYDKKFAAAIVATAGGLGVIIPPSIPFIMYGVTTGESVGDMFTAGIIPGILIAVCLMVYCVLYCVRHGEDKALINKAVDALRAQGYLRVIWSGIPALLMPVIVLGGIYSGIFTPTESAVVGCVYTLLVSAFVYKSLSWEGLKAALVDAGISSATIMLLFGGANTFGRVLTLGNVPNQIVDAIFSFTSNKFLILLIINILLLLAGMFIDTNSCVVLFSPIIVPLMTAMGYDLITAGVMIVVNLCIGMVTPPMGPDLFITMKIADTPLQKVLPSATIQIGIMYLVLAILVLFPVTITFIPKLLGLM